MDPIRDGSVDKTMQANGITYEEATKHVYDALMPEYTRELMKIYIVYTNIQNIQNIHITSTVKFGSLNLIS